MRWRRGSRMLPTGSHRSQGMSTLVVGCGVVHRDGDGRAGPAQAAGVGSHALQRVGAVGDRGRVPLARASRRSSARSRRDDLVGEASAAQLEADRGHVGRRVGVEGGGRSRQGRTGRRDEHARRGYGVVHRDRDWARWCPWHPGCRLRRSGASRCRWGPWSCSTDRASRRRSRSPWRPPCYGSIPLTPRSCMLVVGFRTG